MKWQNVGSAPCYRPYRLAYRLSREGDGGSVIASKITVNQWLPGSIPLFDEEFFKAPRDLPPGETVGVADKITLPKDMATGVYILSLAVVGEETTTPVVRLGIKGRDKDGWYPLSRIRVSK